MRKKGKTTSKYRGVYMTTETNKYGKKYYYWYAQLIYEKKKHIRRCISEEHACEEYDKMCMEYNLFEKLNYG